MPGALSTPNDPSPSPSHIFYSESWVPSFRSQTARTRFITLPSSFLTLLLSDTFTHHIPPPADPEWSDGTTTPQNQLPDPDSHTGPAFPGIEADIEAAIAELGGAVCPKLKDVCPVDATWVNFHRSTKCTSAEDVLTLLASSELVLERLEPVSLEGEILALRQWAELDEAMEFRTFVRERQIIGVMPRNDRGDYDEAEMDGLVSKICGWYAESVRHLFEGTMNYVLDVYIDRGGQCWVVDFGEWGAEGVDGLFEWQELETGIWMERVGRAQFRCVDRGGIRASRRVFDGLPLELRNPEVVGALAEAAERLTRVQIENEAGE